MDMLGGILMKALSRRGLHTQAQASFIVFRSQQWIEKILPELTSAIHAEKFQDGTLFIRCDHSIALQECQAKFADLQAFLTGECRFGEVKSLRVSRT